MIQISIRPLPRETNPCKRFLGMYFLMDQPAMEKYRCYFDCIWRGSGLMANQNEGAKMILISVQPAKCKINPPGFETATPITFFWSE